MISPATSEDIPRLLAMGGKFSEKAKLIEHVGYDPASMERTFNYLIDDENCCLFVGDSGAIGGIRSPHPFNHEHWIAQELFWWSEGREGLRLLGAFEFWASEKCSTVRMITLEAIEPETMGLFYRRRGYEPLEHGYIKRL
jgi:hypothetical protein